MTPISKTVGAILRAPSQAVVAMTARARRVLLYPLPHINRWGLYLPAAFLVLYYGYWRLFVVYPGYSVAILGLAAVVMTVRADKFTPAERVIWVLIAAALMVAEVRVLYTDRVQTEKEQTKERSEAETRFEKSVQGFQEVLDREDLLLKNTLATNKVAQESLANITGGKTFIVLTRLWGDTQEPSPAQPMWSAFSIGGATLHSVSVEIVDADQERDLFKQHPSGTVFYTQIQHLTTTVSLGDFAPSFGRIVNIGLLPQKRTARIFMNFFALNGSWHEDYVCREIKGTMEVAIKVVRNEKGKDRVIYKYITKEFPLDKTGRPLGEDGSPMW